MKINRAITLNELINLLGKKSENQIRNKVHSLLSNDKSIDLVKKSMNSHLITLKGAKKNTDILSQQLNLPTKTDIANIAKLGIQIEEKLDALDEKILPYIHQSPQTNNHMITLLKSLQKSKKIDKHNQKEVEELIQLLKMNIKKFSDSEYVDEKLEKRDKRVKRRD